jgi:hypothetical protein
VEIQNQRWIIQRNCQQDEEKHNTVYIGHHYMQTNTNNVNMVKRKRHTIQWSKEKGQKQ